MGRRRDKILLPAGHERGDEGTFDKADPVGKPVGRVPPHGSTRFHADLKPRVTNNHPFGFMVPHFQEPPRRFNPCSPGLARSSSCVPTLGKRCPNNSPCSSREARAGRGRSLLAVCPQTRTDTRPRTPVKSIVSIGRFIFRDSAAPFAHRWCRFDSRTRNR
jgi:hypothetical protein